MKKRSRRRKRKVMEKVDNFSKGLGLSPGRIVLSLILLGVIGYFIFSIATKEPEKESAPVALSEEKVLKQELTTDQKLAQLRDFRVSGNENFLVIIESMAELERSLEKIESEIEPTEAQSVVIDEIRLRNKSVTLTMMASNGISCDAEKVDLLNFCMARANSEHDELREGCQFWLCSLPALDLAFQPSETALREFSKSLQKYPDSYLLSPDRAKRFAALMINSKKSGAEHEELFNKAYIVMAEQYDKSELQEVRDMSAGLRELAAFGQFNLPTLENRVLWGDPSAAGDLAGAFETLSKNPNAKSVTWLTIIRAYERYLAVDKIEEAGESWQKMWAFSESLEDKKAKEAMQGILTRQRTRAVFMGRTFDVTGTTVPDGEAIESTHQEFVAIIFCDKGTQSLDSLVRLGKATRERQLKYLPVIAFENELSQRDMESLHMVPREIKIASHETSQKFFKAFPADFFPYVILVNKKGEVVSINVDIEQIDSRVAKVEAAERRKQRQAPVASQPASDGSP